MNRFICALVRFPVDVINEYSGYPIRFAQAVYEGLTMKAPPRRATLSRQAPEGRMSNLTECVELLRDIRNLLCQLTSAAPVPAPDAAAERPEAAGPTPRPAAASGHPSINEIFNAAQGLRHYAHSQACPEPPSYWEQLADKLMILVGELESQK